MDTDRERRALTAASARNGPSRPGPRPASPPAGKAGFGGRSMASSRGCPEAAARGPMSPEPTLSIAHVDAEQAFSGGEVQVFLLMEGLGRRGHRNVLIAPPGSASEREGRARGLEVHAVPMRSDLDLPAVVRLERTLRRARVDLVHLHTGRATWLGAWAALLAGRRAVSTRRQERPLAPSARTRLLYGRLLARTVAISPAVAECLRQGGVRDPVVIASSV